MSRLFCYLFGHRWDKRAFGFIEGKAHIQCTRCKNFRGVK